MPNPLESIYKRFTGLHPRKDLQPPLCGAALAHEVRRLRQHTEPRATKPTEFVEVSVYETGRSPGENEPFTVLQATLSDGSIVGCYLIEGAPEPDKLLEKARSINPTEWFSFNPDKPQESGI